MAREIRALIVDDSRTTRKMVMTALDQAGLAKFEFTEAEDGLDALQKFRPDETDIIFTDMHMPRMDGVEFLRELHSLYKTCPPAVMITGESSKDRLLEALSADGVDALLIKPVDRDRLRTGLKALVDSIPERSGPCLVPHGECVPEAVKAVLLEACQLELTAETVDEAIRRRDIVYGSVAILGDVQWSVVLGFERDAAARVASAFAGYDITPDHSDMGDAIGELANIVGARIKSLVSHRKLEVAVSLPTVVSAKELRILVQRRRKTAADVAQFNSPLGRLWTEVTVGLHAGMVL